jgi:SAM-dependent methyltransferase
MPLPKKIDSNIRLQKNNAYYDRFLLEVGARSESRDFSKALKLFLDAVLPNKTILDIGCGTGTHLQEFHKKGFSALGIEPSIKMRERCESLGLRTLEGAFENLESLKIPEVGGIWCAASLLHVPREDLKSTFEKISNLLPPSAPLYFTVRLGEGAKWDQFDGVDAEVARFIQLYSEQELIGLVSSLPFELKETYIEESTWGRPSKWISVFAIKRA